MDPNPSKCPYFWLPKRLAADVLALCERRGITSDQLIAHQLGRLASDPDYRRRILAVASIGLGWPEDLADCLLVATLRAKRYRHQAEALLLSLNAREFSRLDQYAIRCGLDYDQLVADWIKKRLQRLDGEIDLAVDGRTDVISSADRDGDWNGPSE